MGFQDSKTQHLPHPHLQEFTFTAPYCKGKYNTFPHAQSRTPPAILPVKRETTKDLQVWDDTIWKLQQEDEDIPQMYNTITISGEININPATHFTISEDKVCRVLQLPHKTLCQVYIPSPLRQQLLHLTEPGRQSG